VPLMLARLRSHIPGIAAGVATAAAGAALLPNLSSLAASPASPPPAPAALDSLSFKEQFKGQLTPPLPAKGADSTPAGAVVRDAGGVCWQRGPYGGWWLRLGLHAALPTVASASAALDEVLTRAGKAKAAVYVAVQETVAEPSITALLRERGFRYHHFSPNEPGVGKREGGGSGHGVGEHVYYRWMGDPSHDMVPSYSTSIEGVGALVLSPDEKKVLLIWEYGNWKAVSGAVDEGESLLTSLAREASEEVGLGIDDAFAPVAVGGWHLSRARDDRVNDNFSAFVVRATSERFRLDMNEVSAARWFDTEALLEAYQAAGAPDSWESRAVVAPAALAAAHSLTDKQLKISVNSLVWLHNYASGHGIACKVEKASKPPYSETLHIGCIQR